MTEIGVRPVETTARSGISLALSGAAAFVALATWLVLAGRFRWAGGASGAAGALLVWSAVLVRRDPAPLHAFLDSAMDRIFDGCLLSAFALTMRETDRPAAAAAAVSLVLAFLGAYVLAKGRSLGYPVENSLVARAARYALVAAGLLVPQRAVAMFALLALTLLTTAVRASQVAKQERE